MPLKSKFEASRFASYHLLLSKEELDALLPDGIFVRLGKLVDDPEISKQECISMAMNEKMDKVGFALKRDHFTFVEIAGKGKIAKPALPVVEISSFAFMITSNGKLLEEEGKDCLYFGVSISYPTLFSVGEEVEKTRKEFEEAKVFHGMRSWIRKETRLALLDFNGEILKGSFRISNGAVDEAKKRLRKIEGLKLAEC